MCNSLFFIYSLAASLFFEELSAKLLLVVLSSLLLDFSNFHSEVAAHSAEGSHFTKRVIQATVFCRMNGNWLKEVNNIPILHISWLCLSLDVAGIV